MPTLDLQIEANADDDRVYRDVADWSNTSSAVIAGYWGAVNAQAGTGMRFTGVNIPAGATITVAYLTFTAGASHATVTVNSDICCENANNPGQIADYADHIGRARTVGAACIAWDNIGAWVLNTEYQSPSIVAPVQKVVDDQAGTGDALIIFWEDKDDESTHGAETVRQAHSHNSDDTKAPKLHIEYTVGNGDGIPRPSAVSGIPSAHF